ncbi:unnamed protein product [Vicia faba]|uniref:ATP-dependent DNA helicase n=1 Tax=Vicia faba TaxID=3906 RepID=A0AAV1AV26_VICFA|nr:unnamed protein product [Vicia faba]
MEIEKQLQKNRRSLKEFKPMSYTDDYVMDFLGNRLVYDERQYDISTEKDKFQDLFKSLRALNSSNAQEIESFSKWILDVGDGKISEPNDEYAEITIPPEFLLTDFVDPIEKIVTSTYPNLLENFTNLDFLQSRAILASTIEIVDEINDYITNLLSGYHTLYMT